jgi:hypothetical protein
LWSGLAQQGFKQGALSLLAKRSLSELGTLLKTLCIIGVYSGFARLLFAASVSGQPLFGESA